MCRHFDSYPFVCVLMLSDSVHLKGGQTVLRKADGTNAFVPLPPIGHAVILHGSVLPSIRYACLNYGCKQRLCLPRRFSN